MDGVQSNVEPAIGKELLKDFNPIKLWSLSISPKKFVHRMEGLIVARFAPEIDETIEESPRLSRRFVFDDGNP